MILFRILFFPVKLLAAVAAVALRVGLWLGALPFRVSGRAARLVGLKGTVLFGAGAALGLLLAPGPGSDLRRKLQGSIGSGGAVGDDDLGEKVRFELAHAPRTWHLPQPTVTVAAGRVVLSGEVSHDEGSEELARVAAGVPGVTAVENRLVVVEGGEELLEALVAEELAEELVEELVAEAIAEEIVEEIVEELVVEAVAEELAEEMVTEELAEELAEELVADGVPEDVAEELAEEIAEELVAEGAADEMIEGLTEVLLEVADAEAAAERDDED